MGSQKKYFFWEVVSRSNSFESRFPDSLLFESWEIFPDFKRSFGQEFWSGIDSIWFWESISHTNWDVRHVAKLSPGTFTLITAWEQSQSRIHEIQESTPDTNCLTQPWLSESVYYSEVIIAGGFFTPLRARLCLTRVGVENRRSEAEGLYGILGWGVGGYRNLNPR